MCQRDDSGNRLCVFDDFQPRAVEEKTHAQGHGMHQKKPPPEIDKDTEMSDEDSQTSKTNVTGSHNATTMTNSNSHNTHNNSRPMTDCNNIIANHHYYQAPIQNHSPLFVVLKWVLASWLTSNPCELAAPGGIQMLEGCDLEVRELMVETIFNHFVRNDKRNQCEVDDPIYLNYQRDVHGSGDEDGVADSLGSGSCINAGKFSWEFSEKKVFPSSSVGPILVQLLIEKGCKQHLTAPSNTSVTVDSFGQPIGTFQPMQGKIADMYTEMMLLLGLEISRRDHRDVDWERCWVVVKWTKVYGFLG
ncbi:hypothetical protein L218DRAFT_945971 [Marasmius fiardii PR-910]|nr:hypothetical protein L218DRAFT_945971 [Marasmius fiardii PR-910]